MSCVIMYRVTLTGRIEVVGGGTEFIDRAAARRRAPPRQGHQHELRRLRLVGDRPAAHQRTRQARVTRSLTARFPAPFSHHPTRAI